MAKIVNIKSGSSAFESNSGSSRIGFFKGDVKYTFLSKKTDCTGAILPAFNPAYDSHDPAFKTSYCGYREATISSDGINNEFSGWMVSMRCYTYFGKGWHMILSPSLMGLKDPIDMLRRNILNKHKNDTDLMNLVELPKTASYKDKLALPYQQTMGFLNAYCTPTYVAEGSNDRGEDNRVLVLTKTAANKVYEDLNTLRPAMMQIPRDEHWSNYMYGDVTVPGTALRFHSSTCKTTNGGEASCLSFGKMGRTGVPILEDFNITNAMLAGRVALDDDDVLYIPSYNELVDLLIEEGTVPFDLIDEVCSDDYNGAFPRKKSPAKQYNAPAPTPEAPKTSGYAPNAAMMDDPEDDIPMGDSPAPVYSQPAPVAHAASTPAAPASSAAGTDEERAEWERLRARLMDTTQTAPDMATISRYRELAVKFASAN